MATAKQRERRRFIPEWQRSLTLKVSATELATMLAALRLWQQNLGLDGFPAQANAVADFGDYFRGLPHLDVSDIDELCERINS